MKSLLGDKEVGKAGYWRAKLYNALWGSEAAYRAAWQRSPEQLAFDRHTVAKVATLLANGTISEHSVSDAIEAVSKTETKIAKRFAYFHHVLTANLAERGLNLNQLLARVRVPQSQPKGT